MKSNICEFVIISLKKRKLDTVTDVSLFDKYIVVSLPRGATCMGWYVA